MIVLALDLANATGWAQATLAAARDLWERQNVGATAHAAAILAGQVASGLLDLAPADAHAARPALEPVWSKGKPFRAARVAKKDGRVLEAARAAVPPRLLRPGRAAVPAAPAEAAGARYARLRAFLDGRVARAVAARQPLAIVAEAPLEHHAGAKSARVAYGLAAVVEGFAFEMGLRLEQPRPYDLQRWFLGRQADAKKNEMMLAAKARLGYQGDDDNEADALILLAWAGAFVRDGT